MLAEEFGEREKMIASFSSSNVPDRIPIEIATALFRITQEGLRNVAKHAGKTHVRVSLKGAQGKIQLQIADFGQGFDPKVVRSGLGLLSMEERVRNIGGTFDIQSTVGEGTRITVEAPLP
jgi:signal transduction histidine kinase